MTICRISHDEWYALCNERDRYAHANREQAKELTNLREEIALFGAWQKRDIAQGEEIERLKASLDEAVAALEQIAKGEGRFSLDHHEHACNTIEDMKALAVAAIDAALAAKEGK